MDKNGYWFLWVIFIFNCCTIVVKNLKINTHLSFLSFEIVFCLLYVLFSQELRFLTSINECVMYWPFLYLGWLLQQSHILTFTIKNRYFILLVIFLGGIVYSYALYLYPWFYLFFSRVFAFILIIGLFSFSSLYFGGRAANGKFEKKLSLLGRNTLQIYVLHYFALKILTLGHFTLIVNNLCQYSEILVAPFISLIIALLSLYTSKIMYKFHFGFLFGR